MPNWDLGTAINFSLYKPVAENDTEKIKSYMIFYKKIYRVIALVVTVIGLLLLPFLDVIIPDPGDVSNVSMYYLIFLFNTVSSYFVSYKFSLVNAEQKNYVFSYIRTITYAVTTILQIVSLVLFHSFLVYLLIAAFFELTQKIFITIYLNKKYPYLLDKNVEKLDKRELKTIKNKVFALIWHKIGEISIYQTDNIIVSAFINVATVGVLSNYNMIIASVSGFITIIFKSTVGSLGNLIATEDTSRQLYIFRAYRFVAFWLYGFSAIAFFILLSPFISLWLNKPEMIVSETVVLLIIVNYYMSGNRACVNNVRNAGGVFEQGKYLSLIQGAVNLVVSIVMVKLIGLPGVFVGTIAQGILASTVKPIIIYKHVFKADVKQYFLESLKYAVTVIAAALLCWVIKGAVMQRVTILNFIIMVCVVTIIPNAVFFVLYRKTEGMDYLKQAFGVIKRRNK